MTPLLQSLKYHLPTKARHRLQGCFAEFMIPFRHLKKKTHPRNAKVKNVWVQLICNVYINTWNPNDPCFDWSLGLLSEGWSPKMKDKQGPGILKPPDKTFEDFVPFLLWPNPGPCSQAFCWLLNFSSKNSKKKSTFNESNERNMYVLLGSPRLYKKLSFVSWKYA